MGSTRGLPTFSRSSRRRDRRYRRTRSSYGYQQLPHRRDTHAAADFSPVDPVDVVSDFERFCTNTGFISGPIASRLHGRACAQLGWLDAHAGCEYVQWYVHPSNGVYSTGVAYDTSLPTLTFELHGVEVSPSPSSSTRKR